MTKSQDDVKYIVFWETREGILSNNLQEQALIFATILKMIECDRSVELCGRCEGVIRDGMHWYNGFVLFKEDTENINTFCKRYEQYINITGKHRYKNIQEMRDCISNW